MDPEIARFRRAERDRLIAERRSWTSADRETFAAALSERLDAVVPARPGSVLGITWPIKGEIDIRPWALAFAARHGLRLALPVVVAPKTPLVFRPWSPDAPMERGVWNILVPATAETVRPDAVIAPLVGFQAAGCFRLGYGGGYFDRTLAALAPRPHAIGLGLDAMEIPTIRPEPHDIPMDAIVTETRVLRRAA